MARVSQRGSTSVGLGRVQPNPDQVATLPAMPAVDVPAQSPSSSRRETRSGPVAIRANEGHREAPLSRSAVQLLRRTVPRVLKERRELARAPLDHREGFVLSLIDGSTSVQALIDVAAMPDGELIAVLQRLRHLGIITLG